MKKAKSDELRPDYRREDLGPGVRGKYLEAYRAGTNLVLLSPDVAKAFPNAAYKDRTGVVEDYENRYIIAALVYEVQRINAEIERLKAAAA